MELVRANLAELDRVKAERLPPGPERQRLLLHARARLQGVVNQQRKLQDLQGECYALRELSATYRALGEMEKARVRMRQAHRIAHRMSSAEELTECLAGLAQIELARKRYDLALKAANDAVVTLSSLFDSLPPGLAALARGRTAPVYEAGLQAAVALGDAEHAYRFLDGGRAGSLRTELDRVAEVRTAPVDPHLEREEQAARGREANAYASWSRLRREPKLRLKETRVALKRYEHAREVRKRALQLVQLEKRVASDLRYPAVLPSKEVRGQLDKREAIVLYGTAGSEGIAIVMTPKTTRLVRLGPQVHISRACHAALDDPDRTWTTAEHKQLRKLAVEPLQLGPEVKRVLLSTQGCLAYQPPSILFPEREVACISSASAFATQFADREARLGPVLAMGDPFYGSTAAPWGRDRSGVPGGVFARLPHSGAEARAVGDIVLTGREASESRLRAELAKNRTVRAVHIACHGHVDESTPDFSALALSPTSEDDGLLTALEVYELQIRADLVVLSACDSGRGLRAQAEGIVGLTSAFLFAGAQQVLVSLWRVDDEASRELMIEFHRRWNHKDPKQRLGAAAALRAAQVHVRDYAKHHKGPDGKGRHPEWARPHYWAAWQLWGAGD